MPVNTRAHLTPAALQAGRRAGHEQAAVRCGCQHCPGLLADIKQQAGGQAMQAGAAPPDAPAPLNTHLMSAGSGCHRSETTSDSASEKPGICTRMPGRPGSQAGSAQRF